MLFEESHLSDIQEEKKSKESSEKKSVYQYNDFRLFLQDSLLSLQKKNPSFSATAFCRKAGFGENSRGYFGLIVKGKRNLGNKGIVGFSKALKLSEKEATHFENLVHYNQAKREEEKKEAFNKLQKSMRGTSKAHELLSCQYRYFSNWYYVAIRELIGLASFQNDENWIALKLKSKISKKQVREALQDLESLGLIRAENRSFVQSEPVVQFTDSSLNYTAVNNIHRELLELSKEALENEDYENRSISSVVIGTKRENFELIREEIKAFREEILNKYCTDVSETEVILNLGVQLQFLTE